MSRLTVTRYSDLEAARRREAQREIKRLRKELQRCIRLEKELARLEAVEPRKYAELLSQLNSAQEAIAESALSSKRREWLELATNEAARLEAAIIAANECRLQLEFAALTLVRGSDVETGKKLEQCARRARNAKREEFAALQREFETITTARLAEAPTTQRGAGDEESVKLASALMRPISEPIPLSRYQGANEIEGKVRTLIGEIAAMGTEVNTDGLLDRAEKLLSLTDDPGFQLKLDSLMIDASELSAESRRRKEMRKAIELAEEALEPFDDPSSTALKARLAGLESSSGSNVIQAVVSDAMKHAEQLSHRHDAERARSAILDGLRDLGYEVHLQVDGWGPGDRIAAHKPDEPNYDVQLAAASDGRVQSRVRAYAHSGRSSGTNRRDREVEENWCSDLKALNGRLLAIGIEARVDIEEAPGTAEQVPISNESIERSRVVLPPRLRAQSGQAPLRQGRG
jgi:hypothetical protein